MSLISVSGDGKQKLSSGAFSTPKPYEIKSVGNINSIGTSSNLAKADHTHEGIHAIQADSNPLLVGDIKLASGTGINLTNTGNTITIATTGVTSVPSLYAENKSSTVAPSSASTTLSFPDNISTNLINFDGSTATPTVAGWYAVEVHLTFETDSAGAGTSDRALLITKNASQTIALPTKRNGAIPDTLIGTCLRVFLNGTTDFIRCFAINYSTNNLMINPLGSITQIDPQKIHMYFLHA